MMGGSRREALLWNRLGLEYHRFRIAMVETIRKVMKFASMGQFEEAKAEVQHLANEVTLYFESQGEDPRLKGMYSFYLLLCMILTFHM